MRTTAPTLHAATEINIWKMAFKLTLLASTFMATGYGFLFAVKSIARMLV
jgi:hypothetical protein